ncbi:hypothetical protein IW261DRAFT_1491846 [Armillaria novae-zelandiae]|uniref:Peptidase M20 dimerisation domain-containing protein n=1 Tax=Armillaria novae-zelandiae TaxID=153914 RepID=A0AA39P223_9AGAR|nr:hypothetical protein IW261DRAFT_1491846 [Armillaria novae-zelandiae]
MYGTAPVSPILDPSLSREISDGVLPRLVHSLHETNSSVLSLAASDDYIFSGSQNQDISVWDKRTYRLKDTLRGHTGSVLALVYAAEKEWLFSSSGDSTVRIWSTTTLNPIYVVDPYLETGAGDLFSLAWSPSLQTLYIGCQNTALQWLNLRTIPSQESVSSHTLCASESGIFTPSGTPRKAHKFFDSYPQYERKPADIYANNPTGKRTPGYGTPVESDPSTAPHVSIPASNVIDSAHFGYIYCLAIVEECEIGGVKLISGSGDESIKIWSCTSNGPVLEHEFTCSIGAVFALVTQGDTIYGGCQDGIVKVLDIETRSIVRTIIVQEGVDILSMSLLKSDLYVCLANGRIQRYSASFDCTASWKCHDGIVLSSILDDQSNGTPKLITGGNDDNIKIWNTIPPKTRSFQASGPQLLVADAPSRGETLEYALSKFISFPSVSSNLSNREDCRQAAIWLRKCLSQLGAQASLLPTGEGRNPLVLGTFSGLQTQTTKPRILFYGHYDVMAAPPEGWYSDPFVLTGRNGSLYGRGATDDKGPIMAVACAAAALLRRRSLAVDLVFLIEGEEECGSTGFENAVRMYKDAIGHIDAILVSNSTWITEEHPCITYGLRGVVHCDLEITSALPDLHSGVDGGGVVEPMDDMIKLLATLSDRQKGVQIPGFYDHVRPSSEEEKSNYKRLAEITNKPASSLSSRWREPSLTIHTIEVSGPQNSTVIPGTVKSQVSIRIVPDQDLDTISRSLCDYLTRSFEHLQSPNKFNISLQKAADWWLGNLDDPWFKALEAAVQEEWGVDPLHIREGGSIPSVPYLEKEFGCHALHLPLGQSSDQAHLPNERISLVNLQRGQSVIERFLLKVADANFA